VRQVTNIFGEMLPKETVESLPDHRWVIWYKKAWLL
jgi:hypothetical protein